MSDKLTGTKLEAMYNDLDKKGYWNSDRANFISKFFARGEEGYKVRKMLYDDLHSKGYLSSPSYEEFMRRIGWDTVANLKKRGARVPGQTKSSEGASSLSNQQQKQSDGKASGGWRPTNEQMADAFTWGFNMQQSVNDSMRNTNRKIGLISGTTDKHDGALSYYRHKAVNAGTPTSVVGIRPQAAEKKQPFNGNGPLRIDDDNSNIFYASPIPYDVVKKNGKDVTQWLLPDGTLTTSYMDASNAEYMASRERLAYQFRQRMRDNGLNPSNKTDVEKQMQLDFEAPAREAAAAAWDDAMISEQKQNEAISKSIWQNEANSKSIWQNFADRRDEALTKSHNEVVSRMASHMTNFDMRRMSDKVWRDAGEKMTLKYYYDLKAQNPNLPDSEIHARAQELAKDACNYVLYNYAVNQNAPKSTLEYFMRNVLSQNTVLQIYKGLARMQSGSTGDMDAEEQAMEQYGNNHKIAKYSSIVTGMATDPAMFGSGYVAGLFGKGALRIGGSILSKSLFGQTAQIGTRLFAKSASGRFVQPIVSGAANIGTYEGIKEAANQLVKGGHVNTDGVNEGYSLGDILKSSLHGVVMGAATGTLSPIIGNVADKWVKATSSTAGKFGVRFGEQAISSLAEGTVFAIPEWIENSKLDDNDTRKKSAFDIWSDSMAMMLGFKVSHLVKSAPRVINELRTVKNPRTAEDYFKNRISFEERIKNYLDKSASDYVFSKDEISELRAFGYGKLSDLFRRKKQKAKEVSDKTGKKDRTEVYEGHRPLEEEVSDTATERYRSREFDGYEALERLVKDKNVSQSTRAKAYYVLTGHLLPMGTIMSYNATRLEDGTIDITASTIHGGVVRRWYTKSEKEGKRIFDAIHHQIELNNLDYLERMREVKAQAFAFKQVINEVAPNANANTIADVYIKAKSGNKDYMEAYGDLVNKIDNGLKEKALEVYNNSPEAIRHEIFKDSGINVDDAIRKSIDRRTEEEKKAVESYFRLLKEKIEENDPHADETVSNNPRLESDEVRSRVNENESYARNAKEERQDVKMNFDVKRERAIALEPELESLERDGSLEYYDEIKPDATPEQKQAVKDYAEAKARYDAMLEPLKQRFEEQKEKAESYVDGITNPEDGNVTHVKLKGWKGDYFVISGKIDVLRGENDEIITWNSASDSLVVTDKDGEKRMISLKDIEDVISQQPAEQLKSDLIQKIEQDENALYGEIDGNLSFDNGSKFSIINPEGNVQKVEIRIGEQGQREAVIDEGDGHMSVVPLDENVANKLREMEFAYRKYRYDSKTTESDSKPNNVQNDAIEDDSDIFFGQSEKGNTSSEDLSLLVNDAMRNFDEVFGEEAEERMYEANEHPEDLLNDQNLTDEQRNAVTKYLEAKRLLEESLSGQNNDVSKMSESENAIQHPMTEEELDRQSAKEAYNQALQGNMQRKKVLNLSEEQTKGIQDHNRKMLEEQKKQKEMENNRKPSAMSLIPVDYKTKEPMFEKAYPNAALDAIDELTGGNEENTRAIVNAQVEQASKEVEALKKEAPTKKPATLEGSPMQMAKAQQEADAAYNAAMEKYNADVAAAKQKLDAWTRIASIMNERDNNREGTGGVQEETRNTVGTKAMSHDEAIAFITQMENHAEVAPEINLTIENWDAQFGEDGIVSTPIGDVTMGENQFAKLMRQGRNGKLGMIKPTLEMPDIIIEENSKAKEGDVAERNSSYIFIKAFTKKDGSRFYYFTSISVSKGGKEVVISNQEKNRNRILRLMEENSVIWRTPNDAATSSAERQGLDYEQSDIAETAAKGSGITPQDTSSDGKDTESAEPVQTSEEKSDPEAQKKAGETADEKSDVLPPRPEASEGKNTDESQESAADERADKSEQKQTEASNATAKEAESETDGKKVNDNISSEEPASPSSKAEESAYTIEPSTYTNKKGKTSDVSLLKFNGALTAEQERAIKEFAKERMGEGRFAPARGWKDRESGGWIFRNEEDARKAAEMVGNEESVADAQPMTAQELRDAVEPNTEKPKRTTKQPKPANKVESVPAAEPAKEEKPQYEVSDEELGGLLNDIRDILGIGDDEGDAGFHFRDPDELTAEQRQKLMSVGQRAAMAFVERGDESFADYATMMVKALGDKVRPWLKAFYAGLEYVPGFDKYALTPYDEVKAFDVENFDKAKKNMLSKADMMAEEGKAQKVAGKANNELKTKRNERRKKDNEQKSADTAAVAEKAGTAASEAESVAKSSKDRQELSEASGKVDDELEDVDNQLALLGYYESDRNDMADAEKKAVNNAANLAKSIINDLGLDLYAATHEDSLHGGINKKKPLAVADIGGKFGSIRINIPLGNGRLLNIELTAERTIDEESDNSAIKIDAISVSVIKGSDSFGHVEESREFFADGVKYKDLLESIQLQAYKYIEYHGEMVEGVYHSGDKVQYSPDGGKSWHDAIVVQPNDEGGVCIDTGQAPVMYVNAHLDQLRHKENPLKEVADDFYDNGINEDAVAELPEDDAIHLQVVDIINPGMTNNSMKSKIDNFTYLLPKISNGKLAELDKKYGDNKFMGSHIKAEVERRKEAGIDATNLPKPTKEVKPEEPVGEIFSRDEEKRDGSSEVKTEIHRTFAEAVKKDMLASLESGTKPYRGIVDLRNRAKALGMDVDDDGRTDILLQELVEDGLVRAAREVVAQNKSGGRYSINAYEQICKLYEMQPTITARSSNRIKMQQYSTPLPMSFNAARFAMRGKLNGMVLEPTAGNGMLVFAIPSKQVHVNELDGTRLGNLREQGFALVTQQDATQPFEGGKKYDVVICNPPFGKLEAANYDGKMIGGLDPQIALNALASMKDDGRAAIIIGGNMEYAANGSIKSMKPFFTYLYDHYNVKGVVDMDGKLYAKQGTTFPTRMILIDGRRSEEERAQSAVYPPVKDKAIRKADSFEDLFRIVDEILNSKGKTNGTEILRSKQGQLVSVGDKPSGRTDQMGHREQHRSNGESGLVRGGHGSGLATNSGQRDEVLLREPGPDNGDSRAGSKPKGNAAGGTGGHTEPTVQRVGTERISTDGVGLAPTVHAEPKKRELTDEKSAYRPHNTAYSLKSVAPAAMVEAMDNVLTQIEKEHGSIDNFVTKELGYDSVEDAHHALAAEQMDSVAMAIYQMKHGQALIIGDQTGVGKGRQMAALIRWAVKRGEKPVFITQKADLFSDIYRDLVDVGSGDLVPFIFNSDGAMVDSNGKTVHKPLSQKEQAKVFASGKLPDEYDFAVLTYSQVNTGDDISQKELKEAAKQSGARTKKSKSEGKPTPKATFLRAIAKDNYLLLDESHTAAGTSNTGAYLQSILRSSRAATFASATFAKRPDTMPLYAIRTAMSQANVEPNKMISIIEKGGVTLQEIMSRELTNAGQMVRRERDMSDVRTDWKTIDDAETVKRARENYDKTIAAFNAIIKFQKDYVKPLINILSGNFAFMAGSAGVKRGTDKMGVDNAPFANKTYNYTKQLMLALKVDAIVDEVEKEINAGRHPVIALESTMEGIIKGDYSAGETIDEPTFSASLLKGLDSVMQYTIKDEDGNEQHLHFSPSELGKEGEKAYYDLQNLIRENTSDIFISPLDAIIGRLHEKGYKVGELTGRKMYVERGEDGKVVVKRRTDKDKKRMQREFNNGGLDVLILNKSAATGISLHASEKFSDQRQRSMIIAQPLSDINDYMQMIGRIDRTGQVHRGYYINLGLPVPAENRFLMMLSTKLKSLNANTTTSQDSESNEVDAPDLLNKYGSQVVVEYLRDNPEIYEKMGAPLKKSGINGGMVTTKDLDEYKAQEDDARKITGYVALLSTKEQEDFYDDVVRRYNELIKYLNDTGNNDLKITVMPLRAKTLEKHVSSAGIDPNGSNPFAQNSYVEKVEMDVLRKPMKADEVRNTIEQVNKGKSPEDYLHQVVSTINAENVARLEAEDARYEKDKQSDQESIAKQTEKINAQKKRTAEEKTKAISDYTEEKNAATEAKHTQNVYRIKANSQMLKHSLNQFEVGKSYLVPDNLEDPMFDFASPAIFCGYKTKDRKITASTTLAVFATLDGRRRVEVKLSQMVALQSILKMTNDNWDSARSTTLDNWDSQIPTETRKEGYVMTGNILQAIADTQGERGGYPGQLISYTDMDGNVHDGILMPDRWNPTMLKSSGAPIISRMQQIMNYEPVKSSDGNVEITGSALAHTYYLTVPRSKKDGAKYFENPTLLRAAVGSNFFPYHGKLRADIVGKDIETVVNELSKLGVRVQDEKSTTDEGRKFRLLEDDDPKVKELEALPEDELVPVYRNVQAFGDDALGSPMAFFDAETGERRTLQGRRWNYSEAPEVELTEEQQRKLDELNKNGYLMVDGKKTTELPINDGLKFVKPKTKDAQLHYLLKKNPEDSGTWAAYDPYDHAIETPLNTQFAEAYKRPNLVVVRSLIPKSEITEPFHADYALLPTGAHQWNNGRTLYLSRWSKIDKVLTREEEAKLIDEYWKKNPGKREALKTHRDYNRFVPEVRKELEKMGYRFEHDGKVLTPEESLALDQQRETDVIPGREGHLPNITGEDIERINAKMSGKWVGEPKEAMENEMAARVEDLSEKLHTPVRIIRTDEEVSALPTPRQRRQKGSFNSLTGEVTIVVPNNANLADIENTFIHEVVGHDGLRVLFPDEEKLNNALDELYRVSNDSIKHTIDRMAQKMYDAEVDRLREQKRKAHEAKGEDANASYDADMAEARAEAESKRDKFRRDATEEYGADLAGRIGESGFEKMSADELTFWGKLKATLQRALQKLLDGLKILSKRKWGDKEWAFVLHEAYKRKKNGGRPTVFDAADTVVKRRKTGFDDGMMFRDGDMGLDETITKMKLDAAAANADSWKERQEAIKAIGGNLSNLHKAMSYQRDYDLTTVKSITDLAKLMLDHGLLDDLSKYETKRILSAVNNAHGKKDVSGQVQKIMDIMVDNQIRLSANEFGKMLSVRGKKVDGRGIEVQGELDADGQAIVQTIRRTRNLDRDDINMRIADALDRMGSEDSAIANEAELEYNGLVIAFQYAEDIKGSKVEESDLRKELKEAAEEVKAGYMSEKDFAELKEATNEAIRENKIERAEHYREIVDRVGDIMGESAERALAWRNSEKKRVREIQHNANSDMEGRPNYEHHKEDKLQKLANNDVVRIFLAPLGTFDQMLRMFGSKSVNGEGYLWNRYMRGWVDATEKEYTGYQKALDTLDEKVSEVFGKKMKWGDLFSMERKLPKATVTFRDGGEMKAHELAQGNLLYIYMVDKMADGRMKLRRMGITEEDVNDIKNFVDPRFIELADWMQDEFLVEKRNEYNEVHKRMFGSSMAAIENYFPLKILANARIEDVDVADETTDTALPATSTGSIIKRRRNTLALDVMGADAFSVILEHIQQMERWASFAELNRDLNALLSYKRFRNQVMNMTSVYGGGKTLWNNFRNVCSMAAGAYRPPVALLDRSAVNIAKGVTAAKISLRMFTALKQFLSMPAYLSDSNPIYLASNLANPIGAWKWSMDNLPIFEKRWKSRIAGDPRLLKSEKDWTMWRTNVAKIASRFGMLPNAFVDALTVAIGAHSMYQTRKQKYLRYGYNEVTADKRAKQDATILFNQTQQSSEGAFLSTMQVDRSWLSVLFTIFRNSSMSYTRQLYDAMRNLKRRFGTGYKNLTIEFMSKQMQRDGIERSKAEENARLEYGKGLAHDIARIAVFGFILQFAWNLGSYLPYLLLGRDDDKKGDFISDAAYHAIFGGAEGLTSGDVISNISGGLVQGKSPKDIGKDMLNKEMPLTTELRSFWHHFGDNNIAAANDCINILSQTAIGVNPETITNILAAIYQYCGDDPKTDRECALLIARVMNVPQSQLDEIYFDELGVDARDASKMTPAQIAERYAKYKSDQEAGVLGFAYNLDDDAYKSTMERHRKKAESEAKSRLEKSVNTDDVNKLLDEYDAFSKQRRAINKLKREDVVAYRDGMQRLHAGNDIALMHRTKRYKHDIKVLEDKYLKTKNIQERNELLLTMQNTKRKYMQDVANMNQK